MKDVALSLLVGGAAGALVGLGVWAFASRRLEQGFAQGAAETARQLGMGEEELARRLAAGRETLKAEVFATVPPLVRSGIDSQLASYGLTRETGRRIGRVLAVADSMGWL